MRFALATVALALTSAACGRLSPPPAGSYSEVVLFADGDEWAGRVTDLLTEERDYFVSSEAPFQVEVWASQRAAETPPVKNVVICGVLDARSEVGARIRAVLDEAEAERVRREGAALFTKPDVPRHGQLTLVITAVDPGALRGLLDRRGDRIQEAIEASARARLRENLLAHRHAELDGELRRRGFHLDVPLPYTLHSQSETPPGVELQRDAPPRVLGVFWRDAERAPSPEDLDGLFAFRADYVRRRYDGDEMDRARVRCAAARLGPYPAVRMCGYWHNDRFGAAGGYYETYFVWEAVARRIWAVDLVVYAPGREKTTLVRELLAVAETFRLD
jgi:hypothetical protein